MEPIWQPYNHTNDSITRRIETFVEYVLSVHCFTVSIDVVTCLSCRPVIRRIAGDRHVEYGDGGTNDLVYPVWVQEALPISQQTKEKLVQILHDLGGMRVAIATAITPCFMMVSYV